MVKERAHQGQAYVIIGLPFTTLVTAADTAAAFLVTRDQVAIHIAVIAEEVSTAAPSTRKVITGVTD